MNAELICEDIRYWMGEIKISRGYSCDVQTVLAEWLSYDDARKRGDLPLVAVFPAKSSPTPAYEAFGSREEFVDVVILAFVPGDDAAQRGFDVRALEDDIQNVLTIDRSRDRWAVDTTKHVGQFTDVGDPPKGGVHGDIGTLVTGVRCNYYPDEDSEHGVAHAELYISTPAATPVGTPSTYVQALGTYSSNPDVAPVEFVQPTAGQAILRYTGKKTRTFLVEAELAGAFAGGAPTMRLAYRSSSSGAWSTLADSQRRIAADPTFNTLRRMVSMVEGSEIAIFLTNTTADAVTLSGSLSVTQVPRF